MEAKARIGRCRASEEETCGRIEREKRIKPCHGKAGDKRERQLKEKGKHLGFGGVQVEGKRWHLVGTPQSKQTRAKQVLSTSSFDERFPAFLFVMRAGSCLITASLCHPARKGEHIS